MNNKLTKLFYSFLNKNKVQNNKIIGYDDIVKSLLKEIDNIGCVNINPQYTLTDKELENYYKLKELGFLNNNEVLRCSDIISTRNEIIDEATRDKEAKDFFNNLYPQYLFITDFAIRKALYPEMLFISEIQDYYGLVNEDMIKDIEDFKISDEYDCYLDEYILYYTKERFLSKVDKDKRVIEDINNRYKYTKCEFEIINKIEKPIILKPVIFKNNKYYLIVSKL